jgi:hypothetical protein
MGSIAKQYKALPGLVCNERFIDLTILNTRSIDSMASTVPKGAWGPCGRAQRFLQNPTWLRCLLLPREVATLNRVECDGAVGLRLWVAQT